VGKEVASAFEHFDFSDHSNPITWIPAFGFHLAFGFWHLDFICHLDLFWPLDSVI